MCHLPTTRKNTMSDLESYWNKNQIIENWIHVFIFCCSCHLFLVNVQQVFFSILCAHQWMRSETQCGDWFVWSVKDWETPSWYIYIIYINHLFFQFTTGLKPETWDKTLCHLFCNVQNIQVKFLAFYTHSDKITFKLMIISWNSWFIDDQKWQNHNSKSLFPTIKYHHMMANTSYIS